LASELVTGKGKTEGDLCHEKYDELKRRWEDANGKVKRKLDRISAAP
jgi:hypothetical protein